jgi:hypothetical protein
MNIGPIFFAAPWALAALAALPVLFMILRATPPAPRRAAFPPLRLLMGLATEEESRRRAPLWLVILRALAAALLIIGFARPSLAPQAQAAAIGGGPVLIVIDDGWTSAPVWADVRGAADAAAAETERSGAPIHILLAAPSRGAIRADEEMSAAGARAAIARLEPRAWRPDRADALKRLADAPGRFARIAWLSDGLDGPGAQAFGDALAARGPLLVRTPGASARALIDAATAEGLSAQVTRGADGATTGALAAETLEGRSLGAAPFRFEPGTDVVRVRIDLPPEIAARAARIRIVGEPSAGAVRLLPAGSGRPLVGLVDAGVAGGQTLLQDLYYVERAITPFATARRGDPKTLISQGAQALILADASRIAPTDRAAIDEWLARGGLLVRFAGPRLANDQDDLLPVRLRPGARALGGALAWEQPQKIAPPPDDSPFAGVAIPEDVAVRRQVLGEPGLDKDARVWASLSDGAPIVTAAPRGRGLIVLYHVTAGPNWSDLPLSGLYVDMLRRTLAFSGRAQGAAEARASTAPWRPTRLIDGFGAAAPPRPDAPVVPADAFAIAKAGPNAPPGLYERAGGDSAAIDAAGRDENLAPLPMPPGAARLGMDGSRPVDLGAPMLALAALAVALDLVLSLHLAGRLPRLPRRAAAGAAALLLAIVVSAALQPAYAQVAPEDPTMQIRLAYVRTGDPRVDRMTAAGLQALTGVLIERTAVEPGPPVGVDPARDDLSVYPILYWAAPSQPQRLSDAAVANLDRYMRLGGLLFVDTRDAGAPRPAGSPGPAAVLLQGFDAPPLEPISGDKVLGKSFYLLNTFPGRMRNAKLWAESASAASARDGVAALMVGDGDWAAAWAADAAGRPLTTEGRQRELALRFGINLVMLALTGNYKGDQVHLPALLQRLGQQPVRERRR